MRKRTWIGSIALAAVATMAWAGTASAADVSGPISYEPPPTTPEKVWSWTGFHVGVDAGGQFDFVHSDVYSANENAFYDNSWEELNDSADLGARNWFFSGDIGADYQIPNSHIVFGLFAGYDWHPSTASASHDADADQSCPNTCTTQDQNTTAQYKDVGNTVTYGDAWGVGARAGVLVNPKALVYVLGGYGQKQISAESFFEYDYYNGQEFEGGLSSSGWRPGWFVGGGVEAAVGTHATLGLEYRMAQYEGFSASCELPDCAQSTPGGYQFNSHSFEVGDTISHTVRARLSFWLNH